MKHFLLLVILNLVFITLNAQAPGGAYGEYIFSYSVDKSGNTSSKVGFSRIRPVVVTTNFGFVQSSACFSYMDVYGTWNTSPEYDWVGFQNGWYVYANRFGANWNYFLISQDYRTVRTQNSNDNGICLVYTRCDPNERMNNAPTY